MGLPTNRNTHYTSWRPTSAVARSSRYAFTLTVIGSTTNTYLFNNFYIIDISTLIYCIKTLQRKPRLNDTISNLLFFQQILYVKIVLHQTSSITIDCVTWLHGLRGRIMYHDNKMAAIVALPPETFYVSPVMRTGDRGHCYLKLFTCFALVPKHALISRI